MKQEGCDFLQNQIFLHETKDYQQKNKFPCWKSETHTHREIYLHQYADIGQCKKKPLIDTPKPGHDLHFLKYTKLYPQQPGSLQKCLACRCLLWRHQNWQ